MFPDHVPEVDSHWPRQFEGALIHAGSYQPIREVDQLCAKRCVFFMVSELHEMG